MTSQRRARLALLLASLLGLLPVRAADRVLHVFVLAGQSNMEGKAPNALFNHQATNEATQASFAHLRKNGDWAVRDDVFIKYLDRKGRLTIGYGSPGRTGPELEFGTMMGDRFEEPVLLIKTAWGGHALYKQFRPPSAGLPMETLEKELRQAQERAAKQNEKAKDGRQAAMPTLDDIRRDYGASYRRMLAEVRDVLSNAGVLFPELQGTTPRLAGFVWFQGWNDQYGSENEYRSNLEHFISDVRRDLAAPRLPFVIAAMGQNGSKPAQGAMRIVRDAQLAMNEVPEFAGTVRAFRTDVLVDKAAEGLYPTWQKDRAAWDRTGGDHPYHYLGSALWFTRIGHAMGETMGELLGSARH